MIALCRASVVAGLICLYAQASRYDNGVIDRLTGAELLPGIVLFGVGWLGSHLIDAWRERKHSANSKKRRGTL